MPRGRREAILQNSPDERKVREREREKRERGRTEEGELSFSSGESVSASDSWLYNQARFSISASSGLYIVCFYRVLLL